MTVQEFFDKWNGKGCDFDGYYGFQCMDLYQQYTREVVGGPHIPAPAAADVWNTYAKDYYDRIANTPTGVPQLGDVMIWKKASGLPYGHIAVFKSGDVNRFTSFDQNWPPGTKSHFQDHNYTNVQGWLRPKKPVTGDQAIIDQLRKERDDNWRLYEAEKAKVDGLREERDRNWRLYDEEKKRREQLTQAIKDAIERLKSADA